MFCSFPHATHLFVFFCCYRIYFAFILVSQFIIFVPLLTLDQRRIGSNRNCFLCCIQHDTSEAESQAQTIIELQNGPSASSRATPASAPSIGAAGGASVSSPKGAEIIIKNPDGVDTPRSEAGSAVIKRTFTVESAASCTREIPDTKPEAKTNVVFQKLTVEYFLNHVLVPLLSNRMFRFSVIFVFAAALAGSIVSLQWLDTQSDLGKLVPDDSFILDYADAQGAFGTIRSADTISLVIENRDFSQKQTRQQVFDLIDAFEAPLESKYVRIVGDVRQWVDPFEDWVEQVYNLSVSQLTGEDLYYSLLREFTHTAGREWEGSIVFNDDFEPKKIAATRVKCKLQVFFLRARARCPSALYILVGLYSSLFRLFL